MAFRTGRPGMAQGQRKAWRMLKSNLCPGGNRAAMTRFAAHRKASALMIGIGRRLIILAMARAALQR